MIAKVLKFTVVLIAFSVVVHAQDYAFKVLVTKGKNEVKSGANWEPLKVGASLKSLDEVKLAENSYLGLIHNSGKPLEVKEAKKYKVSDLVAKVGTGATVLNKYTEFIMSSNTKKGNNLTATGAVHRGVNNIRIYLPKSELAYVFSDTVTVEWEKEKGGPPYVVTISTLFGDELLKKETTENTITINLADPKFTGENEFQMQVFSKKDRKESETYTIRKASKAEKARLKPLYAEIMSQTSANTAINRMYQAGFLEQNKMFIEGAAAFQKAVKLEPSLKDLYIDYLLRNGMKDPEPKK